MNNLGTTFWILFVLEYVQLEFWIFSTVTRLTRFEVLHRQIFILLFQVCNLPTAEKAAALKREREKSSIIKINYKRIREEGE